MAPRFSTLKTNLQAREVGHDRTAPRRRSVNATTARSDRYPYPSPYTCIPKEMTMMKALATALVISCALPVGMANAQARSIR